MKVIRIAQTKEELQKNPLFTGPVTMQKLIDTDLSKRFLITQVNFGKGVRNKFHKHTIEQILIVTRGKGIVATADEEVSVEPGDVIFIPAGEKHWHGAAKDNTFSHLYVMSPESQTIALDE